MESIDRLRDWLKGRLLLGNGWNELNEIADAIESEVKVNRVDAYTKGYDEGFASADDWAAQHEDAMAERGWVRLPLDAEGVPIHVGDLMEVGNGRRDEVRFLTLNGNGWTFNDKGWVPSWSHHHTLTVEDVLRDYASRILIVGCIDEEDELVAEYAAKLRLAGDE